MKKPNDESNFLKVKFENVDEFPQYVKIDEGYGLETIYSPSGYGFVKGKRLFIEYTATDFVITSKIGHA